MLNFFPIAAARVTAWPMLPCPDLLFTPSISTAFSYETTLHGDKLGHGTHRPTLPLPTEPKTRDWLRDITEKWGKRTSDFIAARRAGERLPGGVDQGWLLGLAWDKEIMALHLSQAMPWRPACPWGGYRARGACGRGCQGRARLGNG